METPNPWKRKRSEVSGSDRYYVTMNSSMEEFDEYVDANIDLDIHTKKVALKVSPYVVSLVSLTGGKVFSRGSGTIIGSEEITGSGSYQSIILTSASLLKSTSDAVSIESDIQIDVHMSNCKFFEGKVIAYDLHYNIATIGIKSDALLPIATLRFLDDSISLNSCDIPRCGVEANSVSFVLRPHSNLCNLRPGDMVVAIGRLFDSGYNKLMAAPGEFSVDCCKFDCRELFRANCKISKCGIGGPLVNSYGEVIGVNFFDSQCTPFLPINIASKCLEHFKKDGRFYRPWLGMEVTNLYVARVDMLEKFIQNWPNIATGVFVEEVMYESPADSSGILPGDVIIECGKNLVRSVLEFHEAILEKPGEPVVLVVLREDKNVPLKLTLVPQDTTEDFFNSWPVPAEYSSTGKKIRYQ